MGHKIITRLTTSQSTEHQESIFLCRQLTLGSLHVTHEHNRDLTRGFIIVVRKLTEPIRQRVKDSSSTRREKKPRA